MPLISPSFDVKSIILSQFWPGAFSRNSWKKPVLSSRNKLVGCPLGVPISNYTNTVTVEISTSKAAAEKIENL